MMRLLMVRSDCVDRAMTRPPAVREQPVRCVNCAGPLIAVCGQKCLAARSPSRTVPETADTAIILIRFCVTTDIADAAVTGGGLCVPKTLFELMT
jgi:hypothetical protein